MCRTLVLLSACCALLVVPSIRAQEPPTGPPSVILQLRPGQGPDQPRQIVLGPHAVGLCKRPTPECSDSFTLLWTGPPAHEGEKLQVTFVTTGSSDCLDMTQFTIDGVGPSHKKTVAIRRADGETMASCPSKGFFFYEVSCIGGEGGNCGGVQTVDPGAMVEGG